MKQNFKKVCLITTVLTVAGCQGAYNTTTGSPEPVLDMRAKVEKPAEISVIPTGGIIMKKSYDSSWEMPKREADVLRAEIARLQNEFVAIQTGQAREFTQKFNAVESRVREMRMQEMRQAAQDAELMALVKAKFDVIDQNLDFLKASEAQQISEKDALLEALDQKFQAVDERLVVIDKKGVKLSEENKAELRTAFNELESLKSEKQLLISALDKKFGEMETKSASLKSGLDEVSYEQEIQKRIAEARKAAMEEAREIRLLEELEMRKQVEEARRMQIAAVVRNTEEEKRFNQMQSLERAKKQSELEFKLSGLKQKLATMEAEEAKRLAEADERRAAQQKMLDERLAEVKNVYDAKFKKLEAEKAELLKRVDANKAEKAEVEKVNAELLALKSEHQKAIQDAERYRTAIEERVFAMEAKTPVEREEISAADLGIGRVIETDVKIAGVEVSPAPSGGVIGGYASEDWMDLEDYQVVLHENNTELEDILNNMVSRAEPYVGPWQVKWKLRNENMDVLKERFSLDVETDFNAFASYLSNYMKSYRGFGLTFNIFRKERVLVITD